MQNQFPQKRKSPGTHFALERELDCGVERPSLVLLGQKLANVAPHSRCGPLLRFCVVLVGGVFSFFVACMFVFDGLVFGFHIMLVVFCGLVGRTKSKAIAGLFLAGSFV